MQVGRIALQTAFMAFAIAAPLAVRVERALPDVGALTSSVESLVGVNDAGDAGKSVSGVQSTSEGVLATVPAVSPVENTVSSVAGSSLGAITRRAIPDVGALATGVESLVGVQDVGGTGKSVSGVQSTSEGVLATVPAVTPVENTASSLAGTGLNAAGETGALSTVQGVLPIRRQEGAGEGGGHSPTDPHGGKEKPPKRDAVSSVAGTSLNAVSSTGVVSTVQGVLPIRRRH